MIKEAIVKIVNKQDLTYEEAFAVMNEIMSGGNQPYTERCFSCSLIYKERKGGDYR